MAISREFTQSEFIQQVKQSALKLSVLAENFRGIEFPYMARIESERRPDILANLSKAILEQQHRSVLDAIINNNQPPSSKASNIITTICHPNNIIQSSTTETVTLTKMKTHLANILHLQESHLKFTLQYFKRQLDFYSGNYEQPTPNILANSTLNKITDIISKLELLTCGDSQAVIKKLAQIYSKNQALTETLANELVLSLFVGRDILEPKKQALHPMIESALTAVAENYLSYVAAVKLSEKKETKEIPKANLKIPVIIHLDPSFSYSSFEQPVVTPKISQPQVKKRTGLMAKLFSRSTNKNSKEKDLLLPKESKPYSIIR